MYRYTSPSIGSRKRWSPTPVCWYSHCAVTETQFVLRPQSAQPEQRAVKLVLGGQELFAIERALIDRARCDIDEGLRTLDRGVKDDGRNTLRMSAGASRNGVTGSIEPRIR